MTTTELSGALLQKASSEVVWQALPDLPLRGAPLADGVIPDIGEAVESPQHLTGDPLLAQHVLDLVPAVPTLVWGRDESQAGEMWNSNSLTSWLIARSGLSVESVHLPAGGRAPGWRAGLVVVRRPQPIADSQRSQ